MPLLCTNSTTTSRVAPRPAHGARWTEHALSGLALSGPTARRRAEGVVAPSKRTVRAFFAPDRKTFHPRGVGKFHFFARVPT